MAAAGEERNSESVARAATIAAAKPAADVTARAWVLHFADHEPLEVWFAPAADHATALAAHPDALAAEPLGKTPIRAATADEAEELRALIAAIYGADTEADRRDAMRTALTDPGGALTCYRAIAEERGLVIEEVRTLWYATEYARNRGIDPAKMRKEDGRYSPRNL